MAPPPHMEFKEKFVGFVDILGFKNMIEAAESGTGRTLDEIKALTLDLGTPAERDNYRTYGPSICPHSARIEKSVDFEMTQISDCVIVSAEVSPAGVVNLVGHCWLAAIKLLTKGVMVRGYITRGKIFHKGEEFFGTGYHQAIEGEKGVSAFKREVAEKGTPFIEVDKLVTDYVKDHTDKCVQDMFGRKTKSDGNVTAIFPFQVLGHSFMIGGPFAPKFDPAKERKGNDNMRQGLIRMKADVEKYVDQRNPRAVQKAEHYIAALDAQLAICDRTDQMIDRLCQPLVPRR